ncbi:polysaccharide deacetylase family protein [Acetohalobium arabaticum]|uniref:Polysaccharide deacetylase n=1 Tax=Acetohalobium arabaticum (strain ATCC 49924 / DSM 5501 / Z-7288) TaxID=574087 RepID=D9QQJ2_ACEAZ|nr:polysaccharide deacetylase family protein [Acetohalobium arabaticum]ADL12783.1 polysaccharide deacetylase [Acetohalobium arabaticum DSM 5501]
MSSTKKNLITLLLIFIIISTVCITSYAASNYTIQSGDSLFSISRKYNTNVSTLAKANKIKNPNLIYSGSTLQVPDAVETKSTKDDSNTYTSDNWLSGNGMISISDSKDRSKKIYRRTKADSMQIALTFDDGPDKIYTPQILKILKKYDIKATFFLLGKEVQKYPQITKQIIEEGHLIGNHSWSHPDLTKLDKEELKKEVLTTEEKIKEVTGRAPALIRPPYGAVSDEIVDQLKEMNYKIIHWSVDSLDWNSDTKEEILDRVLPRLKPGVIILFHSSIGKSRNLTPTVQALPAIIEELQKRNIELVTVDKLLSLASYKS